MCQEWDEYFAFNPHNLMAAKTYFKHTCTYPQSVIHWFQPPQAQLFLPGFKSCLWSCPPTYLITYTITPRPQRSSLFSTLTHLFYPEISSSSSLHLYEFLPFLKTKINYQFLLKVEMPTYYSPSLKCNHN